MPMQVEGALMGRGPSFKRIMAEHHPGPILPQHLHLPLRSPGKLKHPLILLIMVADDEVFLSLQEGEDPLKRGEGGVVETEVSQEVYLIPHPYHTIPPIHKVLIHLPYILIWADTVVHNPRVVEVCVCPEPDHIKLTSSLGTSPKYNLPYDLPLGTPV